MVPAEGGPKNCNLKSSWRQRRQERRSKILAVSLKYWKGRRGGGGFRGGGGYPPPPTVYGRSNTSLATTPPDTNLEGHARMLPHRPAASGDRIDHLTQPATGLWQNKTRGEQRGSYQRNAERAAHMPYGSASPRKLERVRNTGGSVKRPLSRAL